jgi:thiol:disulfide interchange protein DsbD
METVRQFTAFPLYATVLWLLYVFSRQTSADAAWRLMIGLLLLALAAWGWGVIQRAGKRGWLSNALVAATAACALLVGVSAASLPIDLASHDASAGRPEEGVWGSWSPERVAALQADGRPVFVNFTADWCLSCQVNERTVFSTAGVRELFQTYDVRALKADWTNKDDRIAKTLAAFGRDGVPLYVFYPAGGDAEPQILPQLPTESALRAAFASGSERVQKTSPLPNEPRKG